LAFGLSFALIGGVNGKGSRRFVIILFTALFCIQGSWQALAEDLRGGCSSKIKRTGLQSSSRAITDFLNRTGMKPAFTAAEEKAFFADLLALEDRIIQKALELELTDVTPAEQRAKRVSQMILPMLKRIDWLDSNPSTQSLAQDLRSWDQARDEFIRRNLGLLVVAVQKIKDRTHWEFQIGEQLLKLNQAFQAFEPKLGFKFSTYAMRALYQGIGATTAKLLSPHYTSARNHYLAQRIRRLKEERFRLGLGEMSVEEVAAEFKISKHRAQELLLLSSIRTIDLDAKLRGDSDWDNGDLVEAPEYRSEKNFEASEQRSRLMKELLDKITDPDTREIVAMRSQGMSLIEIAKEIDGKIQSKQGIKLRYEEGLRALRAVVAIESGQVKLATSREILIDLYGLYGRPKRSAHLVASEHNRTRSEILALVERLTRDANEDWLEKILESRESHR
jgi:DNA-directed RNA polymerase sigma subunit (sigma70/sigma32)